MPYKFWWHHALDEVHVYADTGQAVVSGGGSFLPFFMAAVPTQDNPSPKRALVFINLLVLWNSICFCLVILFFFFQRWPPSHSLFLNKTFFLQNFLTKVSSI